MRLLEVDRNRQKYKIVSSSKFETKTKIKRN